MSFDLSLVKIPVHSVADAAVFYRDTLGFEEQFIVPEYGWAQYQAGSVAIALYQPGMGGGNVAPGTELCFQLSADEATFSRISSKLPDLEILKGDDDTVFMDVRDLDGNVFRLTRV